MIDLHSFCAPKTDPRTYLLRPFSFDAFTCASNGALMVIVERRADAPETLELARLNRLIEHIQKTLLKRGRETEIRRLDSISDALDIGYLKIGAEYFQTHYLRLFSTLPNAEIHAFNRNEGALVTFTDGFGILMPYHPFLLINS